MPFHSTTIFTLAHLLPLSLAHLPLQNTPFKLAILYNNSIADAHPSFLLEEAILYELHFGKRPEPYRSHYTDVIMGAMASQITSLNIIYSTVYSGADQRKHQSPVSLAFVRGIHRGPVNSPHKWLVTRKMFPFDDVIMSWSIHPFMNIVQWQLVPNYQRGSTSKHQAIFWTSWYFIWWSLKGKCYVFVWFYRNFWYLFYELISIFRNRDGIKKVNCLQYNFRKWDVIHITCCC